MKRGFTPETVSYRAIRRRLFENDMRSRGTQTDVVALKDLYSSNWQWHRDKIRLGSTQKRKLIEDAYVSYILRWQSLENFNSNGGISLPLGYVSVNSGDDIGRNYLPMYAFDLSSLGIGRGTGFDGSQAAFSQYICPLYRLYKNSTGDATQSYFWEPVLGRHNNIDGVADTYTWGHEHISQTSAVEAPGINKYLLEWSDIRMILRANLGRPTRVTTKVVQFLEEEYGPQRYFGLSKTAAKSDLVTYDGYTLNTEIVLRESGFWDKFWANKDTNPLRSVKNDTNDPIYRTLYQRFYDLPPDDTTDSDDIGQQKICKLFVEQNTMYNTNKGIGDKTQEEVVNEGFQENYGWKAPAFRQARERECSPFPDKDRCRWLLIYSTAYNKAAGLPYTASEAGAATFDLLVRNKYTLNAGPGTVS